MRASVLSNVQIGKPIKVSVLNIMPRVSLNQPTGVAQAWGGAGTNLEGPPPSATNLIALAAGLSHVAGLTAQGTVVVWGSNALGQTQVPSALSNVVVAAFAEK